MDPITGLVFSVAYIIRTIVKDAEDPSRLDRTLDALDALTGNRAGKSEESKEQ